MQDPAYFASVIQEDPDVVSAPFRKQKDKEKDVQNANQQFSASSSDVSRNIHPWPEMAVKDRG